MRTAVPGAPAMAAALLLLSAGAPAATPPAARGPIARIGDRRVEEADIRAAAAAMAGDPLRTRNPRLWRKALLDRCIDRELLAREAARRGFHDDPGVKARVADREYTTLLAEIHRRVLLPGIEPTPTQLDSIQASALYRRIDLHAIIVRPDLPLDARQISERLRAGARFDSTARIHSIHPNASSGGHFGWLMVRNLDPRSYAEFRTAKAGDILGPYPTAVGHQIYKIGATDELTRDSLHTLVKEERTRGLLRDYQAQILRRYHFQLDSTQVAPVLFTIATESVDSILSSLGPDGTRPERSPRRALGVIARVDSGSVTFRELARPAVVTWPPGGKMRIADAEELATRAGLAIVPQLLLRDARERGLDREPTVARELRLIRDEEATEAMVAREAGTPRADSAGLRAYFTAHATRYRRPAATRARVACFDSLARADSSLRAWNGVGIRDSALAALGLEPQPRAGVETLLPRHHAEITSLATDADPLALALRTLSPGQMAPPTRTVQGYAVAEVLAREAPRPMTFAEAGPLVAADLMEEHEGRWVEALLARLRAGTKIDIVPARLDAVRLEAPSPKKGTR